MKKPSRQLVDAAWTYILLHNREHRKHPLYVDDSGKGPVITSNPQCIEINGVIAHKGHGPHTKCISKGK